MPKQKLGNEQIDEFKRLYPNTPNKELATMFGLCVDYVGKKAFELGVKKDKEYLREIQRRPNSGQFKKGHITHNKGKKDFFIKIRKKANITKHQFQKGREPHNTLSIGDEREDKDGYIWVKTGTGKTKYERWKPKHHVVFGEPVPKGMILIFKDGNKRNFDKSNLELISRSENIKRNTIHRYPVELIGLMRLNKKLQRKIKEAENARY